MKVPETISILKPAGRVNEPHSLRSMPEQPLLPGFTDGVKPPKRFAPFKWEDNVFLAIIPHANARAQIDQLACDLCAMHGLSGKPLDPSRFHVSLHSLGACSEVPPDFVSKAGKVFEAIIASTPPFEVGFDRALSFETGATKRPFVLRGSSDNNALRRFHQVLGVALQSRRRSFTPHITLLYDVENIAEHPVEPVRWVVNELVLVHSLVGHGRHVHLARWALQG